MAERNVPVFRLRNRGDLLPPGEIYQIRRTLNHGGLCLLPSDTCYALAANPMRKGVAELIDLVLDRNKQKIALSFASQIMVERYVDLGVQEYRLLDAADRNMPLTVVAPISRRLAPNVQASLPEALFTKGELGIRLPASWVERQISSEMDGPITTAAIYYEDGSSVRNFEDAIAVVLTGLTRAQRDDVPLVAVRHPTIKARDVSSVVGFPDDPDGKRLMIVYREGAVERKRLVELAGRITPRDIEDWT